MNERATLLKYGKVIGRAIEELISIVSPATFYRWVREEKNGKPKPKNPKGGQRKPKSLRELVIEIAKQTVFGYTRIIGVAEAWYQEDQSSNGPQHSQRGRN